MRALRLCVAALILLLIHQPCCAQPGRFAADLKALTSDSKIANNVYSNAHAGFRLTLPEPPCDPKLNASVDPGRGNAILLQCHHVVKGWAGMYTLMITADYRANYPTLENVEHYVRSLRHIAERDPNMKSVETEQHRQMSGRDFVQSIISNHIPAGTYYEGVTCTDLNGYLLCVKTEAPSVDTVRALLNLDRKFEVMPNPHKH